MRAIALNDCWGVDTAGKITEDLARRLVATPLPGNLPIRFVERYVFFGNARPQDLDRQETEIILDAGLTLLIVQHVRYPGWLAGPELGKQDGEHAAVNAAAAGYTPWLLDEHGRWPSIALDLEGCCDRGQQVIDHCNAWGEAVKMYGYSPVLYVGYDTGLTPEQLYGLHTIDRYWSDYGQRSVATRGFCCKQHPQVTLDGIYVDPDHAYPDALGGCMTGLSA